MHLITLDLHARLQAALPGVTVLLPDEQQLPLQAAPVDAQGRPAVGTGERGLGTYLATRPEGYVQIERPVSAGVNDFMARWWITVAAIADHPDIAYALAETARRALTGRPDEPGPYTRVLADATQSIGTASLCRSTYEITELDGNPVI
ncbi:hypothetical protein IHN63_01970 [Deinococcus sp. 6YEL10]|uniref:hypothetical protein n=1 Tax=Deinococcus sp. 6YEL10 TaxID=2745870 RepID=UPI001E39D716|nr:hypothetical protein [Deinococcus sp. 6YEL10]MCD0160066.1 hypothetical protein [Deinococcus sp. 6YEL10]